jgi:hypothetical protein
MRKRLYSRGFDTPHSERHSLEEQSTVDVSRNWHTPTGAPITPVATPVGEPLVIGAEAEPEVLVEPPRRYRKFVLIGTLVVAFLGAVLAGAFWSKH